MGLRVMFPEEDSVPFTARPSLFSGLRAQTEILRGTAWGPTTAGVRGTVPGPSPTAPRCSASSVPGGEPRVAALAVVERALARAVGNKAFPVHLLYSLLFNSLCSSVSFLSVSGAGLSFHPDGPWHVHPVAFSRWRTLSGATRAEFGPALGCPPPHGAGL